MIIRSHLFDCIHLDEGHATLSLQNCITLLELFRMMDIHNNASLNDLQFNQFVKAYTDLEKDHMEGMFEMLDSDSSGEMEFEEFYLIFCIMIACKDDYEKEFIYRHSNTIFRLIDVDGSKFISRPEFEKMGIFFNFDYNSIHTIFRDFDVPNDKTIAFQDFRLFSMGCIDTQRCTDAKTRVTILTKYQIRLLRALGYLVRVYYSTKKVPLPKDIEDALKTVPDPVFPKTARRVRFVDLHFILSKLQKVFKFENIRKWVSIFFRFVFIVCCCLWCCMLGRYIKSKSKDSERWKLHRHWRKKRSLKGIATEHQKLYDKVKHRRDTARSSQSQQSLHSLKSKMSLKGDKKEVQDKHSSITSGRSLIPRRKK